jgi:hypothetical protein
MSFDFRALIADQFVGIVPSDTRNIGYSSKLLCRQREEIDRMVGALLNEERTSCYVTC